jgi:hypothetical protein
MNNEKLRWIFREAENLQFHFSFKKIAYPKIWGKRGLTVPPNVGTQGSRSLLLNAENADHFLPGLRGGTPERLSPPFHLPAAL